MPDLKINDFAEDVHANAVAHGWWDTEREFPEVAALIHCEISEAMEEYRDGKPMVYYVDGKPEGLAVELADAMIRILDYLKHHKVDAEKILLEKHQYNIGRPFKHGGKLI